MILGQHIMKDRNIIKQVCEFADLKKSDVVFEIGAGPGNLTAEIAKRCKKVIAVEVDKKFEKQLNEVAEKFGNIEVLIKNVLNLDFEADKIMGNLPYNALEPIFRKLAHHEFSLAVFTVAKGFADKLVNGSAMGLFCSAFFDITKKIEIPRSSFEPEPGTNSMIIVIKKIEKNIMAEILLQGDKKLKNAMREAYVRMKDMTKKEARSLVAKLKLDDLFEKQVSELDSNELKLVQESVDAI